MTDKWTIRKYPEKQIGDLRPVEWFAFAPGVKPTQTAHGAACLEEHEVLKESSLPELLEEIYTIARTVEVKLPVANLFFKSEDYQVSSGQMWTNIYCPSSGEGISIPRHECYRLALHLLALHYEKEQQ